MTRPESKKKNALSTLALLALVGLLSGISAVPLSARQATPPRDPSPASSDETAVRATVERYSTA
jgi:hypothetical protein